MPRVQEKSVNNIVFVPRDFGLGAGKARSHRSYMRVCFLEDVEYLYQKDVFGIHADGLSKLLLQTCLGGKPAI